MVVFQQILHLYCSFQLVTLAYMKSVRNIRHMCHWENSQQLRVELLAQLQVCKFRELAKDPCNSAKSISLQNSVCIYMYCTYPFKQTFCGIIFISAIFTEPAELTESCSWSDQCTIAHSLCLPIDAAAKTLNFVCQCKHDYTFALGKCVPSL